MRLGREHHAALDAIEDADEPLTIAAVAQRAGMAVSEAGSRLRFLEVHGYVKPNRDRRVIRYERGDRGRSE